VVDNYTDSKSYYYQQFSDAFLATASDSRMTIHRGNPGTALCKNAIPLSETGPFI